MTRSTLRSRSRRHLLNPNILIADGDPQVLRDLTRIVGMAAPFANIHAVSDGSAAMVLLQRGPFHVVIAELRIPSLNGMRLFSHVATRYPNAIRIAHSSHIETLGADVVRSLTHKVLHKPATAHQILEAARWAVERLAEDSQDNAQVRFGS